MKKQIQAKGWVKPYPKTYEDTCRIDKWLSKREKYVGSWGEPGFDLRAEFRKFYREVHPVLFGFFVKQVWLDQHFTYSGKRRVKRYANGPGVDVAYAQFLRIAVGTNQRALTANFCFLPTSTYFIDFFPDFLIDNPFKNPEKYKYPYESVSLDFLSLVYQMDNRLALLAEAEEKGMSYAEFMNWVINWAFCHNEDIGEEKYQLHSGRSAWFFIRNMKLKQFWENDKFNFKI